MSGKRVGFACDGECTGLLWEAHFIQATGGDQYDRAFVLWQWRRRRAEVEGRPFTEQPPKSAAEVASERWATEMEARLMGGAA